MLGKVDDVQQRMGRRCSLEIDEEDRSVVDEDLLVVKIAVGEAERAALRQVDRGDRLPERGEPGIEPEPAKRGIM